MHFEDVMIDIETMSLHPHNALILSIGMLEFNPEPAEEVRLGSSMLLVLDLAEQLALGREVSGSTQEWWSKQSKDAQEHWRGRDISRVNLPHAIWTVRYFCQHAQRVWANGTQFDLSNILHLNAQLGSSGQLNEQGQQALWHYQAPRDMRTYCLETPVTRSEPPAAISSIPRAPHDPVYDCTRQAWRVWSHR